MSFTDPSRSYPFISAAQNDTIPVELQSSSYSRPVPSSITTQAYNSQSGNQGSGGFSLVSIPSGSAMGCIKPYSMYAKFTVAITQGDAATRWSFNGPTRSVAGLIRACTVSIGGQVIEQIQNYDVFHNELLLHSTNRNYLEGDSAIQEGSSLFATQRITTGTAQTFCMPLALGLFNNDRAFPLYLLKGSPITIQFDFNTLTQAIEVTAGLAPTAFTVSDVQIIFDHITLDEQYKNAVMMRMMGSADMPPALFQIEYDTVLANKIANSTTVNLNLGLNMSSLKAVLYTNSVDSVANAARVYANDGGLTDLYVYLDGRQVNTRIADVASQYINANKALGLAFTPELSFGGSAISTAVADTSAFTAYNTTFFLGGVGTTRFNSKGLAMVGSPCSTLQIQKNSGTPVATSNMYYMIVHSVILAIDSTGNVTLIR
jgi:hypothetical protein